MAGSTRGPHRKPAAVKILEGSIRVDREAKQNVAVNTLPAKPRGMAKAASQHWDFIIENRKRWIAKSDGPALKILCTTWDMLWKAHADLRPEVEVGSYNRLLRYSTMSKAWIQLSGHFGLSPSMRESLGPAIGEADKAKNELNRKYLT